VKRRILNFKSTEELVDDDQERQNEIDEDLINHIEIHDMQE